MTNPDTGEELNVMDFLGIQVPGLIGLSHNSDTYGLLGSYNPGCDEEHNDDKDVRRSHYLLPDVKDSVETVSIDYLNRTKGKLIFNDASLSYGGFFDSGDPNDRYSACHVSHRVGNDIDINSIDSLGRDIWFDLHYGINGAIVVLITDLDAYADLEGGRRILEGNSIHYRFE